MDLAVCSKASCFWAWVSDGVSVLGNRALKLARLNQMKFDEQTSYFRWYKDHDLPERLLAEERARADAERARADAERARADAERARADALQRELEKLRTGGGLEKDGKDAE
jgi:phage terminase Nu1 subunit (DNA packaging protein)